MGRTHHMGDALVSLPSHEEPAFHICRYPVLAPRDRFDLFRVPFPRQEPWLPGAFAAEAPLLLPEGIVGATWRLPPADVYDGLCPLWAEDPRSPLMAPISTLLELRFERQWGARVMATPSAVGVQASPETLAAVAWAVLCRVPREVVFPVLAELSCLTDRFREERPFAEGLIAAMRAPRSIRGPLLAAGRSGSPLLHPRGVRWVLRELLAASDQERAERARWRPDDQGDESLFARAWFRSLRGDQPPALDEMLLATWMLQESFRGADVDITDADRLLAAVTSVAFRFGHPGRWWPLLERALAIWSVPDSHPAVQDSPLTPSALRRIYAQRRGVSVEQWLAGNWALCFRWWVALEEFQTYPVTSEPAELFRFPMDNSQNPFTDSFVTAFRQHSVSTLAEFIEDIRKESGEDYWGLGSLPQADSLAYRNHPVVELPDGRLHPLSVELVAERAVALHGLNLGGRGKASTAYGRMFEAYVADVLARLRPRHRVITEAEITAVVGQSSRCDALVVSGRDYLAVETSVQPLSRKVATGDITAIRTMAERYQDEADQGVATIGRLPAIAAALGLPPPTRATHLVVSETPLLQSPAFLDELRQLRPGRSPKFVCGIAELELLVELGIRGWGVPTAVAVWQSKPEATALEAHLHDMARILPPRPAFSVDDVRRWISLLPSQGGQTAA